MKKYNFTEKDIEEFIKKSDVVGYGEVDHPSLNHEEKFLVKLQNRAKKFIDLTPYLVKVGIVTIIIFICSILIWNNFIRKDKDKPIIESIVEHFK